MSMKTLYLRPTSVLTYRSCGYQYYLQYVLRIRSVSLAHSLAFGGAMHKGVLPYVYAHAYGDKVDTVALFEQAWKEVLDNNIIQFSSTHHSDLTAIGRELARTFPEYWDKTGLIAVKVNGKALVENRLRLDIGDNVILSGEPDIVATRIKDPLQRLIIPDAKVPKSKAFDGFADVSDQLTAYNLLVHFARKKLGIEGREIGEVGFVEGLKQKTKPRWVQPQLAPARSEQVMGEYLAKLKTTAGMIRRGHFQKESGHAFNSPCRLCDLRSLCTKRDATGMHSELGDVAKLVREPIDVGMARAEEYKRAA